MAEKLTAEQQMAVTNRGGRLLVSAAAGSGKTKVLVDRLMGYLTDQKDPANLDDFLLITYTNAAAAELRGKIASKISERIAQNPENKHLQHQIQRLYLAKISTVHGFCGDVLREYAYRLDLPADFRVADENECAEMRASALNEILNDAYDHAAENDDFCAFVDTQGLGRDDHLVPEIIQKVYDASRCHLNSELWLNQCIQNGDVSSLNDAGKTVWGQYLMEDLFAYLSHQTEVMKICADKASEFPEMAKPAKLLNDTVQQLQFLLDSQCWDDIVGRSHIDYGRLVFSKKCPDLELAERIKAVRTSCKKGLDKRLRSFTDSSAQVLEDLARSGAAIRGLIDLVKAFANEYDRQKRRRRVLDFGDLEHKMLDLLLGTKRQAPTAAAREIAGRFREVMVDEYQDSNAVQDAIFTVLTEQKQNCFMVGDVKQSIYQFRLADPGIFLEKYETYLPALHAVRNEGRKILLSKNFRSGKAVLEAVNDVFRDCMSPNVGGLTYGDSEALCEGIPHTRLGEPEVELYGLEVQEDTYAEDAAFVAKRIKQLLDGTHMVRGGDALRPIVPDDIAILLRSPGSVGHVYQSALEQLGIRCCSGGGTDLLATPEIGTLRSLLQTVSNPRQDIPLLAVLASPLFGFTADDLAEFRSKDKKCCVYDALLKWDDPKAVSFLTIMKTLRQEARRNTLAQLLEKIYILTEIDSIYGAMEGGAARLANLRLFYQLVIDFESNGRRDLQQLLEYFAVIAEKGLISSGEQTAAGCVTLMSIHKSKGLEFPVVILSGLSREFNRESQRAQVLCDKELGLGLAAVDHKNRIRYPTIAKRAIAMKSAKESVSEEMRVLYVAMTRARDRLIMTYPSRNLQGELSNLALRLDLGNRELLTAEVVSPGEWVIQSAMRRMEAGELFALGGRPETLRSSDSPWLIQTIRESALKTEKIEEISIKDQLPNGTFERLKQSLAFQYPYIEATLTPSKQTATQRKGRPKDQEAAELTCPPVKTLHSWRKPSFIEKNTSGTNYGSAVHKIMQMIQLDHCSSLESVSQQIQKIADSGLITQEQKDRIHPERILAFFQTDLGQKLQTSRNVLREFKFSILEDVQNGDGALKGEQVLLQGVVDCAIVEPDGITVIDFKTDYVTKDNINAAIERYRPQVNAYAQALSRIFELNTKEQYLYFFHLNRFVRLM